jgi:hypothetical protein
MTGAESLLKRHVQLSTAVFFILLDMTAIGQTGVKISGDFRYRHHAVREEGETARDLDRFRARIAFSASLSENTDLVLGLASGPSDVEPATRNQGMTGGFSAKPIWFDLAYFNWHPVFFSKLSVSIGKMRLPFHDGKFSELVWDDDVTPEGLHASFSPSFGKTALRFSGGTFFIQERKGKGDAMLAAFDAGFRTAMCGDRLVLRTGIGYYDFTNARGNPTFFDSRNGFGNAVDGKDNYVCDFNELEIAGELEARPYGFPVSLLGHIVENTAVQTDNRAWMSGIRLGKCEKLFSWSILYEYRHAEKDAVIGVFTDSEFAGGGTDNQGHRVEFDWQAGKGVQFRTAFQLAEKDLIRKTGYRRYQADVTVKF